ncbi:MAG: pyridoxal-phosphate dependent enzyme [Bacteroidales bacterium]|nr:pyridoxal-phosphate dependent enzyme [Bacteroidales bacterium]
MSQQTLPTLKGIREAESLIRESVHLTPVHTSRQLDLLSGSRLFFKCENLQRAGAFKFRGASHAIRRLAAVRDFSMVVTHSSGNHAGALALAAGIAGKKCHVVMPDNSPEVKIAAVRAYGARITFCKPTLQAREETTQKILHLEKAEFIHPYDHPYIIAGQGTAMLELFDQMPAPDCIVAPVGGGGLLSGTAIAAKSLSGKLKVYGAEPLGADDAYRSFHSGKIIPSLKPETIADGLLTSLSDLTFKAISTYVDDILTVSETAIIEAMMLIWSRMKIIAEPSACVPLAAVLEHPELFSNRTTGLIISGGNVDLKDFCQFLNKLQLTGK